MQGTEKIKDMGISFFPKKLDVNVLSCSRVGLLWACSEISLYLQNISTLNTSNQLGLS